jgi:hypothetical protein
MARRNGIPDKIDVRGYCESTSLAEAMAPFREPALLVDIEGYEAKVLDPEVNPHLARATMIVELHETELPMADLLRTRFESTHSIEEVWSRPRTQDHLPSKIGASGLVFSRKQLLRLADERRGRPMRWWLLTPLPKAGI